MKADTFQIEPWRDGEGFAVYRYGVFPRHSVLAGRERRTFLDAFDTLDAAREAFPEAYVCAGSDREAYRERIAGAIAALPGEDDADPCGDWADLAEEGGDL